MTMLYILLCITLARAHSNWATLL